MYENGNFENALTMFDKIQDYRDSADKITACEYEIAKDYMENGEYLEASEYFDELGDYEDSKELYKECLYQQGKMCSVNGEYADAISYYKMIPGYQGVDQLITDTAFLWLSDYVIDNGEIINSEDCYSFTYGAMDEYADLSIIYYEDSSSFIDSSNMNDHEDLGLFVFYTYEGVTDYFGVDGYYSLWLPYTLTTEDNLYMVEEGMNYEDSYEEWVSYGIFVPEEYDGSIDNILLAYEDGSINYDEFSNSETCYQINLILDTLQIVFATEGVDITLFDLGFINYGATGDGSLEASGLAY
jgi:tetratricopeptide (TPR) repeat protein